MASWVRIRRTQFDVVSSGHLFAFDSALRNDEPNKNYTICLRFRKTHSSVSNVRNSASTGQVFQSGIGGIGIERNLRRLGQVLDKRVGDQRRVKLSPG